MTYLVKKELDFVLIELTNSVDQSLNTGDFFLFDTVRATGSYSMSFNSSNGVFTLDPSKHYHIVASLHLESFNNGIFRIKWAHSNGQNLSADEGGFGASWKGHSGSTTYNVPNATYTAVYVALGTL